MSRPGVPATRRKGSLGIRAAGGEDARWCAELMSTSEPWITLRRDFDSTLAQLSDPGKELYVAHRAEERVGFVLVDMRGPLAGYIQSICIAPKARNQALGSALLRFAEHRILRDQPNVFLCVSSFNVKARRFYAKKSYVQVGELKDFIIRGASEIILRKATHAKRDFEEAR